MYFIWLLLCYLYCIKIFVLKSDTNLEIVLSCFFSLITAMFGARPLIQIFIFISAYICLTVTHFIYDIL